MKKLIVDQEKCIGCGACSAKVPEVFGTNDEGKSFAKKVSDKLLEEKKSQIEEAIIGCPVQAISFKDK